MLYGGQDEMVEAEEMLLRALRGYQKARVADHKSRR